MQPPDQARLVALVSLLSDENARVVAEARRVLRDHGASSLPALEAAITDGDAKLRARARLARDEVRVHLLEHELRTIGERLDRDPSALEDGCILLARTRDPDVDPNSAKAALDAMADDLGSRLGANDPPAVVLEVMTGLLARELGFRGNQRNYYDPENSYLDRVLERRTGIPISLCAVYLFVARRLSIPLSGVGMPGHFMLRWGDDRRSAGRSGDPAARGKGAAGRSLPALFVDPFGGGRILTEADCLRYLEDHEFGYDPNWLMPVSDGAMLLRMIRNLLLIYGNRGDAARQELLQRMKNVLVVEKDASAQRAPDAAAQEGSGPGGPRGIGGLDRGAERPTDRGANGDR